MSLTLALILAAQAAAAANPQADPNAEQQTAQTRRDDGRLGTAQQGGGDVVVTARRRAETIQSGAHRHVGDRRHRAGRDGDVQCQPADPDPADIAILLDQPAQLGREYPRAGRAVWPDQ